jgi:pre-rRNA-processing protein IPI3
LKCSEDGYYFVSAAQDGHCLVWEFGELFNQYSNRVLQGLSDGINEPKYSWTDHQKEVTDVHCGNYLTTAKCITSSLDASCKLYNVLTGQLIVSIIFETPIHSLAVDASEMNLFVGGENGKIYQTKLYKVIDDFTSTLINSKPEFIGHSSKVTNLSVSFDGLCLISGSSDSKIKKWHIPSKNCMDTYSYKGKALVVRRRKKLIG